MRRSELVFTGILVPLDFLMVLLAGVAAYFLRISPWVAQYRPVLFRLNLPFEKYLILLISFTLFLLVIFALVGLYKIAPIRRPIEDFSKVVIGVSAGLIVLVFYIFISREWFDSRFLIFAGWFLVIFLVSLGRYLISKYQAFLIRKYRFGASRVLIIGRDGVSDKIKASIKKDPALGYLLEGSLNKIDFDVIKDKVAQSQVDEIILADPDWPKDEILQLVDFCEDNHIAFKFVPNLFQTLTTNTSVEAMGGIPIVELKRTALDGWGRIIKRFFDILGSLLGLVLLSPLFLIVALVVKLDSSGSVLVKLKRVSQNEDFDLYKFRSMVKNAEALKENLAKQNERQDGPLFKMKDDPRITRIGKYLRKFRLDEFPQLLNVLKGQMSLIGPRPHQPDEIARYKKHHRKVLAVKAGMTGMAQVSGSSDLSFEDEVKLDTYYIENWSLFLDFKILLKTIVILWRDRSAV